MPRRTEDRTVDVTLGAGRMDIDLPDEGNVTVNYELGAGSGGILNSHIGGTDLSGSEQRIDSPGDPTLTLNLVVDVGSMGVQ